MWLTASGYRVQLHINATRAHIALLHAANWKLITSPCGMHNPSSHSIGNKRTSTVFRLNVPASRYSLVGPLWQGAQAVEAGGWWQAGWQPTITSLCWMSEAVSVLRFTVMLIRLGIATPHCIALAEMATWTFLLYNILGLWADDWLSYLPKNTHFSSYFRATATFILLELTELTKYRFLSRKTLLLVNMSMFLLLFSFCSRLKCLESILVNCRE